MKILITGVCGLIGSNLSRVLLARGHRVWGIDSLITGKREYLHPDVCFYNVDISGDYLIRLIAHMPKYDVIVHLASGKIPLGHGDAERFIDSNFRGVTNVIAHAKQDRAMLIFASSADVYGKQEGRLLGEESDCVLGTTAIARWSYAVGKLLAEHRLFADRDLKFNIIRYCSGYGPYQSTDPIAAPAPAIFIDQALSGQPMTIRGNGGQCRCFCHVDDLVEGTVRLIESDCNRRVFNIGNPNEEIAIYNLAEKIWGMINTGPSRVAYVPHSELPYEEVMSRRLSIERVKVCLGYEPKVSLDDGLRQTIEWQRGFKIAGCPD